MWELEEVKELRLEQSDEVPAVQTNGLETSLHLRIKHYH